MSGKDERVTNALRVLAGEPVKAIPTRWWHAFGRTREFPREDGQAPDVAHQLTVIGPALAGPDQAESMSTLSWGDYLTSWDHPPSNAEKRAVTPEEFWDEEADALGDELDEFDEERGW